MLTSSSQGQLIWFHDFKLVLPVIGPINPALLKTQVIRTTLCRPPSQAINNIELTEKWYFCGARLYNRHWPAKTAWVQQILKDVDALNTEANLLTAETTHRYLQHHLRTMFAFTQQTYTQVQRDESLLQSEVFAGRTLSGDRIRFDTVSSNPSARQKGNLNVSPTSSCLIGQGPIRWWTITRISKKQFPNGFTKQNQEALNLSFAQDITKDINSVQTLPEYLDTPWTQILLLLDCTILRYLCLSC